MRRFATILTGSLVLAASPWTGRAAGGSFDDALGVNTPGIVVQSHKAEPFSQLEGRHAYLATDTHDAVVDAGAIDDRLLNEGRIHSVIEGPIGQDDPSITGEIRFRPRNAVKPASAAVTSPAEQASAMLPADTAIAPFAGSVENEPLLITDRVADAEAIESTGWVDDVKSAFSRLLKRRP
jgi:hypothetical protein